jgi:uncharacterized protein
MKFEWDDRKNDLNLANHELDFANAQQIFRLPLRLFPDDRQDYGEERWIGIGMLEGRTVVIVFTEPDENTIRVISLRKAVSHERRIYEQYLKDELGGI